MVWRLSTVIWVLALLVGLAFYFADDIFAMTQHVLTLDKDGRERIIQLEEMVAKGLGILGVVLTFFKLVGTFIAGKERA